MFESHRKFLLADLFNPLTFSPLIEFFFPIQKEFNIYLQYYDYKK